MFQILLIAFGLSMDTFAVSASAGMCTKELTPRLALRGAFFFGLFQALMPIIGWFLGLLFRTWIADFDHWVAFALLTAIGSKMIYESVAGRSKACEDLEDQARGAGIGDIRSIKNLLTLSLATSMDALAVGLSFSLIGIGVWTPAATIGIVTFLICLVGFEFGRRLGHLFERRAELAGGIVLIAIGCKILADHFLVLKP